MGVGGAARPPGVELGRRQSRQLGQNHHRRCHRFAENHPDDIAVDTGGITVRFWPDDTGELRFTQGAAKTRTIRISAGYRPRLGLGLDSPLVAHSVDAVTSGRVPRILPYLPEQYPNLESHIREELFGWYLAGQSVGFHDFGDSMQGITAGPRTGYSANNEHDALLALTQHYVRSGERAYLESALAYGDHLCDIDLIHHSSGFPAEVGGPSCTRPGARALRRGSDRAGPGAHVDRHRPSLDRGSCAHRPSHG